MATEVKLIELFQRCEAKAKHLGLSVRVHNGNFVVIEESKDLRASPLYTCGLLDRLSSWLQGFEALMNMDIDKRNKMLALVMENEERNRKKWDPHTDPFALYGSEVELRDVANKPIVDWKSSPFTTSVRLPRDIFKDITT